jgi:Holliday junction resolvase-like predicted endonuclease
MPSTPRFVPVADWEDQRHLLGLEGERLAIAFLTSCGWSVEAHRFRLGRHDVDLVIRQSRTVAFVEVKTRYSHTCGSGLEAVNWRASSAISREWRASGYCGMAGRAMNIGSVWWRCRGAGAPHR